MHLAMLCSPPLVTYHHSLRLGFLGSSQSDGWGALVSPRVQLSPLALWTIFGVLKEEEICWEEKELGAGVEDEKGQRESQPPKGQEGGKDRALLALYMQMRCNANEMQMKHPTGGLTERVRLRGLTKSPGDWQGQDPLP